MFKQCCILNNIKTMFKQVGDMKTDKSLKTYLKKIGKNIRKLRESKK